MQMQLPDEMHTVLQRLHARGYDAYAVGGCVRDALLSHTPHDWDVCTSARPEQIEESFSDMRVLRTGLSHGTLTVLLNDMPVEITTFRRDGPYSDHRHPDAVTFADGIEDDLRRRDFTINAMAYRPDTGLIDPYGGEADLRGGVIRCVGDADARFTEDALRLLRALRFAAVLGFRIEKATTASIHVNAPLLSMIAPERVAAELDRLIIGANAHTVLLAYPDALGVPIPEILPCVGFEQRSKYHHLTVWAHTCLCIQNAPSDRIVRLALLLHDIAKPVCYSVGADGYGHYYGHPDVSARMAGDILERLRYDTETRERVVTLVRYHDTALTATRPAARRWLNRIGESALRQLLDVKRADASAHADPADGLRRVDAFAHVLDEALFEHDCFSLGDLAIDGGAILRCGVIEGPRVGIILRQLLDEVIDGKLANESDALRARARILAEKRG